MLETYLSGYDVILGSSSPRRYEIVHDNLGLQTFKVIVPEFEENLDKQNYLNRPIDYVRDTSRYKAEGILDGLKEECKLKEHNSSKPIIVVCADTVIIDKDNKIYEKPKSSEDQFNNLKKYCYSNEIFSVITGVTLILFDPYISQHKMLAFDDKTDLYFDSSVPTELIDYYVKSGEGMNAAGGFKIQDTSGSFIKKIEGDFYNVIGLPLNKTVMNIFKLIN
ncbi:hypothetical protein TPHA_0F01780 [Tetrapisispora phaffii CBS 4417]|uniref:Maf-like protein n=1 Tax=Tetrapisispora phaffii (strain ATCC 24235 / CBS 4417 / NBRC 1672 / NRRL Y-8282 / UCD 70-5) TaxID=1071381 RepID=G8BV80_TETPH|nr:hypothetical protein TPHA_0F01780 [Tetrapisispora phaffii CBS 4417]CCE63662.1 hypothetical protein TPHA_0F01780 [Tetrapisispora phaffii CBS 4417]